ncbi:hypothetical protein [Paracoccus laeviglucosivorans]|uniref:Uncharacterized protein n=1 Tax=Paracoccus laeviglucosivorans TaxID=1197861 RepID=A0A521FC28_9RHOB|nr:hypothetical protein [Paracoccus laeviglucosivorans]SMO93757.1 hypothetical protein SAMN06265221_12037 [Paracoccus laeviglucosivorans]
MSNTVHQNSLITKWQECEDAVQAKIKEATLAAGLNRRYSDDCMRLIVPLIMKKFLESHSYADRSKPSPAPSVTDSAASHRQLRG